ncbi:MAG: BMC domain-containing protein [Deltaproteobacteria bacterium]|nr:BMC domain-containing protein [Deltaproteobacteria bacterium]
MRSSSSSLQALAVIETASIARGFVVLDAVVKKAPVTVRIARPVSPGRFLLVFGGDVASTLESIEEARSIAGSDVVDELFLPGVHHALLPAIDRAIVAEAGESIGVVETWTVSSAILAADAALKSTDVAVLRLHLALGVGGKGWFTIAGPLGDVEAALEAVKQTAKPDRIAGLELIARPHAEVRGFLS